ncbi:PREDICTED: uncharacterized protein LOC104586955 isoform X1 [Nelumbo nucifera]|uniref:Uncharacterized protein LOC104586955 isoform X1 n=1 Tax=Nelumbo nucifera TaxID=4432 RepID=A0A1U7YR87_NELNU|nr:PREDICTED: uncharacterized protein LOC104586955 isoform X1 [Nelumbo nucifera]
MDLDDKIHKKSSSEGWKERIFVPTVIAGVVGGATGLVSKYRKICGLANISTTYAANFAIVTGCYCGAREFVRASRASEPGDLINSAVGGFGCGALLGRLQGGQIGAIRYSVIFAVVGTTVDYVTMQLKPVMQNYRESIFGSNEKTTDWFKLPEWSPIQVLDEEALAAKHAREQQLYAQRTLGNLNKEES